MDTRDKLISALTQYDIKQSKRKGRNIYALGHYFHAVDDAMELVAQGKTIEKALNMCFCDRVLDVCLKAIA